MSDQNVNLLRRAADAISRGDDGAVVETAHPDAVFEPLRAATEGVYRGHEGVSRYLADTADAFEIFEITYTDVRDLGDRVLAIGSVRMRGRASGLESEIPHAAIAEFRDGLIWRYKDYGETGLALQFAGLRE
jgi:ketosteroid isomerase-like protein